MEITCPKCSVTTTAAGVDIIDIKQFGCPNCSSLSYIKETGGFNFIKKFDYSSSDIALKVGQKGILNGIEYTVTGIVVKKVQRIYYWREYILTAVNDEQLYLSETDGHWILLRKVERKFGAKKRYPGTYNYDDRVMKIYDYDDPETAMAAGFFDFDVCPSRQRMIEYIDPPYIFSVEQGNDDEQTTYFGEHIAKGEVKKAFGVKSMPYKSGVGIVQPFAVNVRYMAITFCSVAVLILVSHLFIYSGRQSATVVKEALSFSESNGKDFVTKPFTLQGGSAPLTISVHSDVNNSWASVQVALVNEKTNEEEYASKDIEYYHGYEGGEHWSEGDTNENFNICGVSAGTYHLVITPQKAPEDSSNNYISVEAEWNRPSVWNMVIPIIIMLGIAVLCYYLGIYFEQRRWADSSYSPYSTE